ncbi:MAG: MFS transporter [Ottowia sp.]|nr:MFS transporter [Ottowia sp.]
MHIVSLAPTVKHRNTVLIVMFCHFISAFAALGMPPFFTLILRDSLHNEIPYLAGVFYIVPTLLTAVSSPWWGRLADRFGKRPLLIRAQLGLSISFLLAGYASNTWVFFIALVMQGLLGGTFSASNAYLATLVSGNTLTRSLTAMQWSARAALVVAPICVGLWVTIGSPIVLYRYLALLPLLAAVMISCLVTESHANTSKDKVKDTPIATIHCSATPTQIYLLQFLFTFATVTTFPYFIQTIHLAFTELSTTTVGVLFGLPHLIYLMLALPLSRWLGRGKLLPALTFTYLILSISLLGQSLPTSLPWLIGYRVLMGIAMTAGFITLHALLAHSVSNKTAGRTFGWFESSAKWGGVLAGLGAGCAATTIDTYGPFLLGGSVIVFAAMYTFFLTVKRTHYRAID